MSQTVSLFNVCLLGAGLYFAKRLMSSWRSTPLPPGPAGWPVVGYLFQISPGKKWEDFAALGKKYGDISSINVLGTRYVILNSPEAISAILEKQSIKCSDRPWMTMASELVGEGMSTLFMPYSDRFRHSRRLSARLFGSRSSTAAFYPIGEEETLRFLKNVLRNPHDLVDHMRSTSSAIILKITYGYTIQEGLDPFVDLANKTMAAIARVVIPGAYLVDFIPALRYLPEWLPGMGFLRDARKYRQLVIGAAQRPHQYVLEQMAAGTASPSFSSTLLEGGVTPDEEDLIMWTARAVYLGGSDTIPSTIYAFFLAMVLFPEVQEKAQAELDSVVGNERLPSFNDRDSLPYINALCRELFRWHSATPLAMTHVATEDIYAEGFLIPKGTHIIGNVWGVLRDESIYPNPEEFRPERFLGDKQQADPRGVAFGFGRRICPGIHWAEASIFIAVAMSLAALKISKNVVDGVEIVPEYDLSGGLVAHTKPFKCQITPRSAQAAALVQG